MVTKYYQSSKTNSSNTVFAFTSKGNQYFRLRKRPTQNSRISVEKIYKKDLPKSLIEVPVKLLDKVFINKFNNKING